MRLCYLLVVASAICGPILAQTIVSSPLAGTSTLTIATPPAQPGDLINVFTSSVRGQCGKPPTTPLPLLPNTSRVVLAGTQTVVTLDRPISGNEVLCANIVAKDGGMIRGLTPEIVALVAPPAPTNTPLVNPPDGTAIQVVSDVSHDITVDALLLPALVAKRIFGGELAKHYAVVQMVIANHNQDEALILQSAVLDYSHWLFSNNFQSPVIQNASLSLAATQAANTQYQIPSVDSREVRGHLQDAAIWNMRNTIIRGLALAGAIASSYSFVTVNPDVLKGIANFGSGFVPAFATFWPDRTTGQVDRVNDFGFQTNHVIPKGGSDTIIGFFPLDNFLLPNEKEIFTKAPAAFFTPGQMLVDSKYSAVLDKKIRTLGLVNESMTNQQINATVAKALVDYEVERTALTQSPKLGNDQLQAASDAFTTNERVILAVLQKASLNNIRVVVGGEMTIDVDAVPAVIGHVYITDDNKAATWASGSKVQGTITGAFLSNASVTVTGPTAASMGQVVVDQTNSSDKVLAISFTTSAIVAPGAILTFTVTKTAKNGGTTSSAEPYVVPPAVAGTATP